LYKDIFRPEQTKKGAQTKAGNENGNFCIT